MNGAPAPGGDAPTLDCWYSVRSVYAYFGLPRAAQIARRHGRRLRHRPIDLSRVVPAAGSQPFAERSRTLRDYWFGKELERWSEFLEMPVIVEPVHHYGDRSLASGLVLAAQAAGQDADALAIAILTALWRDDRDVASPLVLANLAQRCGIDPEPVLARATSAPVQAEFEACTGEAIRLGVLGSPTWGVDGELFYGQDRLMFVERHLERPFGRRSG